MRRIYHIVSRPLWEQTTGPYRADSLSTEGFIHCSGEEQVAWAANRFYTSASDLLVLTIDTGRLTAELRDEDAGNGQCFPHIYGPLNQDAVIEARPLRRGADGRWAFP